MARSCHALAGAKHATVDEYIDALPTPLRSVAEAARHVIDAALEDADSAIRWAHPTWSLDKRPVCYLKAASKHVTFWFWHGASIDDRSGRLESSGAVMAHVKLRDQHDVDPELFADWLRQAGNRARRARTRVRRASADAARGARQRTVGVLSRACRSMSEPRSRSVSHATTSPRTPPTLTTRPCGTSTSTPSVERRQGRSSSVPGSSSS